jgi:ATP-dependent exoDNAse (exonuclease V) alpha subunit
MLFSSYLIKPTGSKVDTQIEEPDIVVLLHDIEEQGLEQGDIGTVVHRNANEEACEVEFVTGDGDTVAVLTLGPDEIRLMNRRGILHVRAFA